MGFATVVAAGVSAVGIREYRKEKSKARDYNYSRASLREVMAMLAHDAYIRDLNKVGETAAMLLGYENLRAENYKERHWEPLPEALQPSWKDKSEAKKLGLDFLLRKDEHPNTSAPKLAIIMRGTLPTSKGNLISDAKIAVNRLREDGIVSRTLELVLEVVNKFRESAYGMNEDIAMGGHSLGSYIALQVGKTLYLEEETNIDTHLFNPPMLTLRDVFTFKAFRRSHVPYLGRPRDNYSRQWSEMLQGDGALLAEWTNFQMLEGWKPHFYLNPHDLFCRLFIKYFREADAMTRAPANAPAEVISPVEFFSQLFTRSPKFLPHVVPSAHVYISNEYPLNILKAHSLRQWHKFPDIQLDYSHYTLLTPGPRPADQR